MGSDSVKVTEEQAVQMLSNALVLAGQEMGARGDHWPVIKSAIHDLRENWEQLKIERNVHATLQEHLYARLEEMEDILKTCDAKTKAEAAPKLKELRELYDAFFSPVPLDFPHTDNGDMPPHVERIENIMKMFEGDGYA